MKHNPLLGELRAAFPPEPIIAAGAFDQRGIGYPDAPDYGSQMDGKTWEQLDPQYFARRTDGLSFLGTPYALLAVLPLYLHLLVVFKPTSPVPGTLFMVLTRPEPADDPPHLFDWRKQRFDELTQALSDHQRRVVAATLQLFIADYPNYAPEALVALHRYWEAFTT